MATQKPAVKSEVDYYLTSVPLRDSLPLNLKLKSAQEETMRSLLGSPRLPLTVNDQPDRASALVKELEATSSISTNVKVTGIRPAVDSLKLILEKAFAAEKQTGHDLASVLQDDGMLVVRYRRPTNGHPSTKISNHAWGTAVDFKLVGHPPPANTHDMIPRFIAVLLPFFHAAGWYSGIGFADTMHFEVADGTMHAWADQGLLKLKA